MEIWQHHRALALDCALEDGRHWCFFFWSLLIIAIASSQRIAEEEWRVLGLLHCALLPRYSLFWVAASVFVLWAQQYLRWRGGRGEGLKAAKWKIGCRKGE